MLLVTTPLHHPADEDLRLNPAYRLSPEELDARPPGPGKKPLLAAHISQAFAERLVAPTGMKLTSIQRAVDEGRAPSTLNKQPVRVRLGLHLGDDLAEIEARNVVGYLEGELGDEYLVVGAHHDHLGSFAGSGDTIYNGADDNASGVAGVLELAEAFALRRSKPRLSIVFATFSGEEWYLLGSSAMVRDAYVPPGDVRLMLNLDMIGRNPSQLVNVYGTSSSPDLSGILERANQDIGLPLEIHSQTALGSDHDPFRRKGVPYLFFFTGPHDDYHGVDDEADRLDYARMEDIARLAAEVLQEADLQLASSE
jgi:Zn-dependent M28 family amino/carboxypeptidase